MKQTCLNCQNEFSVKPSMTDYRKCCSKKCYGEYKNKHPEKYDTLFKIGHKNYCTREKSFWLGKNLAKEHKVNISSSLKNNPKVIENVQKIAKQHSGKNHWNWKGGITSELKQLRRTEEYQFWRNKVYAKNNWTCQICERKLKSLIAHHIKSFSEFPKLRFEVSNGLTLCRPCHKKVHEEIGKKTRFRGAL